MEKSVKSHLEEEEDDEDDFVSRTSDGSALKVKLDGKSSDQKANALRSKHSETEQRRRSKINERFQVLRDLIPQNDQKRDKASFLLEVIQYIHCLQERLQMYEGTYQGWSPGPAKLMPWRNNCGSIESLIEQSQLMKHCSDHEGNVVPTSPLLANTDLAESDLSGPAVYKMSDHSPGAANQPNSFTVPLQPTLLDSVPSQHPQESVSDGELLTSQSHFHVWQGRSRAMESAVPRHSLDGREELKVASREASISNAYSQGLLDTLTHALQSSGVDLSQASISVQLDVGRIDRETPGNQTGRRYGVGSSGGDSDHAL